jgi:hypothetical protein
MRILVLPDGDRVEVTTEDDQRFTFPITELQATRRPPRVDNRADDPPSPDHCGSWRTQDVRPWSSRS